MQGVRSTSAFLFDCAGCWLLATLQAASAAQIDIAGPSGSAAFGSTVKVLANGNIVIVDYNATVGSAANAGAVYL